MAKKPSLSELYRPTAQEILDEIERRKRCRYYQYFADTGPMARSGYPKHIAFMRAGAKWKQRAALMANRVGKSDMAAFEITCHLTGIYPKWWEGRRFDKPTEWWAAGDTAGTTRDIIQVAFLGPTSTLDNRQWCGMIPPLLVHDYARKPGVPLACSTIWVRHVTGGISTLDLKCHPAGQRVLMADGAWMPIENIALGMRVKSPDGISRTVTQTFSYSDKPVLEIVTRGGSIRATPNHPFFTEHRGKLLAEELRIGDVLEESWHDADESVTQERWRVCLTAMMIGDGCTRGRTPFFACNEPEIVANVESLLPDDMHVVRVRNTISYKVSSSLYKRNRLKESLEQDGLWGKTAHHKFIPDWVFSLPREQRVEFLRWLWGCDGTINPRIASYTSASYRLINDVRRLLISLGIRAPIAQRYVSNQSKKRFLSHTLTLYGHNRIAFQSIGKLNRDVAVDVTPRPKGPTGEIVAINACSNENVYCVGVDGTHELIVEGFRVGNSFDQKREAFQGTAKAGCWLDEEPPDDIYGESLMRTMTTNGLMIVTFTPLQGLTPFIASWLERSVIEVLGEDGRSQLLPAKGEVFKGAQSADVPDLDSVPHDKGEDGTRYLIMATWDDAPHLTAEAKSAMLAEFPAHQRDARSRGIPALGSGVIYPVPENDIKVAPFAIPDHWPRCFGMDTDTGAGWTAAVWLALDRESNTYYLYDFYKRSSAEPVVHAEAIKARGAWIPGVADAAALLVTSGDSEQIVSIYKRLGLDVTLPDKSIEAGIQQVWQLLSGGRLKVFANCGGWFEEFRLYRRDSKGRIVKQHDHGMDATRYAIISGTKRMKTQSGAVKRDPERRWFTNRNSWLG